MKYKKRQETEVHPCTGCHYWRPCGLDHCCNYIFIEGHMRGCQPGAECVKKIPVDVAKLRQERQELYQNMYFGKQPLKQSGVVK